MKEVETPRGAQGDAAAGPSNDPFVKVLKDLPRLSSAERELPSGKPYVAPPPTMSRMGAVAQGCGGLLVTLLSLPMVWVALFFGYHLWGPGLFLVGGLLLLGGTLGIWRGRRTPLLVAVVVIVGIAALSAFWNSFVPAAAALSPVASLGMFFSPAITFAALALLATLIVHAISLFYWKRLVPVSRRSALVWGGLAVALIVVVLVLHLVMQGQRKSWLDDHLASWQAEATSDTLILGVNADVTLGYSFISLNDSSDVRFEVREAELKAALDSGASPLRVGASGDLLLEREIPRLFKDNNDSSKETPPAATATEDSIPEATAPATEDSTPQPTAEATEEPSGDSQPDEADARLDRQMAYEQQYMAEVADSGVPLLLSDSQYSPYLLVKANDDQKTPWDEFAALHSERIRHYAELYQPAYYEVVTEPDSYANFSGIEEVEGEDARLDAWVQHTEDLIAAVHAVSPDTRIGVTISLGQAFDEKYYVRVLELDGLDFIGLRVYQPAAFDRIDTLVAEKGHPRDFGKELWITETWYGYCLASQRSMDLDARWLEVAVAFAAKAQIAAVFPSDFGCFLQPGGTLFATEVKLDGRTEAWKRWRTLAAQWQGK